MEVCTVTHTAWRLSQKAFLLFFLSYPAPEFPPLPPCVKEGMKIGTRSMDECKIRSLDFSESGRGGTVELWEYLYVASHGRRNFLRGEGHNQILVYKLLLLCATNVPSRNSLISLINKDVFKDHFLSNLCANQDGIWMELLILRDRSMHLVSDISCSTCKLAALGQH